MLRANIKQWEHDFESRHGCKPSSHDIKADVAIYEMYRRYKEEKRGSASGHEETSIDIESKTGATGKTGEPGENLRASRVASLNEEKGKNEVEESQTAVQNGEGIDVTPEKPVVKVVFPTPQLQGRALGLFDVQISPTPATPQGKVRVSATANPTLTPIRTPRDQIRTGLEETPVSKRTPQYLLQRTTLFGSPSMDAGESPLVPRRRNSKYVKTVSQIIEEAEAMSDIDSDIEQGIELEIASRDTAQDAAAETEAGAQTGAKTGAPTTTPAYRSRRNRPKRTTKKVVMRPVRDSDRASKQQPKENYRRMTIHKKKNPNFRRR